MACERLNGEDDASAKLRETVRAAARADLLADAMEPICASSADDEIKLDVAASLFLSTCTRTGVNLELALSKLWRMAMRVQTRMEE